MNRFRLRYSILSAAAVVLFGCASEYKSLKPADSDPVCFGKLAPKISTAWYHAGIDVAGKHLSGLVLTKAMPDSSVRVVFTSEAGVTLFDFEFDRNRNFRVHSIIKKMDRRPVIITLQKDFGLLLGLPFRDGNVRSWVSGNERFFGVVQKKETSYVVTSGECSNLLRLELGSTRKRKVTIQRHGADTVVIEHHTFPMHIQLLRFQKQ